MKCGERQRGFPRDGGVGVGRRGEDARIGSSETRGCRVRITEGDNRPSGTAPRRDEAPVRRSEVLCIVEDEGDLLINRTRTLLRENRRGVVDELGRIDLTGARHFEVFDVVVEERCCGDPLGSAGGFSELRELGQRTVVAAEQSEVARSRQEIADLSSELTNRSNIDVDVVGPTSVDSRFALAVKDVFENCVLLAAGEEPRREPVAVCLRHNGERERGDRSRERPFGCHSSAQREFVAHRRRGLTGRSDDSRCRLAS